jgi:WD40 repeat protein
MHILEGRKAGVGCLAFSADGGMLAVGRYGGHLEAWDAVKGVALWERKLGLYAVESVGFAPGELIAHHQGRILCLDPATGEPRRLLPPKGRRVARRAAVSPDGGTAAVLFPSAVEGISVADGGKLWRARAPCRYPTLSFSGDGKALAFGADFGSVFIHDAATGRRIRVLAQARSTGVGAVALAPDGGRAAVCVATTLALWHGEALVKEQSLGRTHFLSAAWHPSGAFFATVNGDGKADLWDADTGERRESFDWKTGKLNEVVFDRAGDRAACGATSGAVIIWDIDR